MNILSGEAKATVARAEARARAIRAVAEAIGVEVRVTGLYSSCMGSIVWLREAVYYTISGSNSLTVTSSLRYVKSNSCFVIFVN